MEIRPPHKLNYPAIAELLGMALEGTWSAEKLAGQIMADQHFDPNLVWIAREKGEMLGYLATVLEGENAWIKLLAVHPLRRRQGLGREMLDRAEERLFGEGARVMRAGFGPGPLFYPGVPEGPSADFFGALGYVKKTGGLLAQIDAEPAACTRPDASQAHKLLKATSALWWSEVEERLTFLEPRLAMSKSGTALCLADPGLGIGPLFFSDENSADEAVRGALAIAGGGRRLSDFRDADWWQERYKLTQVVNYYDFQKDLKGGEHA